MNSDCTGTITAKFSNGVYGSYLLRALLDYFSPKTAVGELLRGQLSYTEAVTWKAIVTGMVSAPKLLQVLSLPDGRASVSA